MSTADTTDSPKRQPQPTEGDALPKAPAAPKQRPQKSRRQGWLIVLACIVALGGAGAWYWWQQQLNALPPGIAKANGRLEAEQVEIATKYRGPDRRRSRQGRRHGRCRPGRRAHGHGRARSAAAAAKAQVDKAEHEKTAGGGPNRPARQRADLRRAGACERTSTLSRQGMGDGREARPAAEPDEESRRRPMTRPSPACDAAKASDRGGAGRGGAAPVADRRFDARRPEPAAASSTSSRSRARSCRRAAGSSRCSTSATST